MISDSWTTQKEHVQKDVWNISIIFIYGLVHYHQNSSRHTRLSAACLVKVTSDNNLKSKSTSMSNTKKEIMSLRLADEMIFSLCARSHVYHVGFYMIPYIRAHIFGIGSANARKRHRPTPDRISSCTRSLCT